LITPLVMLPDDVQLSDIEPWLTCQACGPGKAADAPPGFRLERSGPTEFDKKGWRH
jgi:hypothetical protein